MVFEIVGPVVIALLAGIVDLFFMVKDETGDAKKILGHGVGALIPIGIFSFLVFNLSFIKSYIPVSGWFTSDYFLIGILVFILMIVIYSKSAVFGKGPGSHEKIWHVLLVALIVGLGPILWPYIQSYIPFKTGIGAETVATP